MNRQKISWLKKQQAFTSLLRKRSARIYYLIFLLIILVGNSGSDASHPPDESDNKRFQDLAVMPSDTLQLSDSIPLPTPEYWRQTSGIQQLENFVIITDLVLQDAYSNLPINIFEG